MNHTSQGLSDCQSTPSSAAHSSRPRRLPLSKALNGLTIAQLAEGLTRAPLPPALREGMRQRRPEAKTKDHTSPVECPLTLSRTISILCSSPVGQTLCIPTQSGALLDNTACGVTT